MPGAARSWPSCCRSRTAISSSPSACPQRPGPGPAALGLPHDAQGAWCAPRRSPTLLFPVHALPKVLRGKFLQALQLASKRGELAHDPASTQAARQHRLKVLLHHDGVVCAQTPLAGPEVALDYLSRYTYRVAVSNQRILEVDPDAGVRLRVRADNQGGKRTVPRRCRRLPQARGLHSPRAAELPASTPSMACSAPSPTTVGSAALGASLSPPHDSSSKPAQVGRLNLTFPNSQTCPHRAAVQSNKVYLTPPASVRLTRFGGAVR